MKGNKLNDSNFSTFLKANYENVNVDETFKHELFEKISRTIANSNVANKIFFYRCLLYPALTLLILLTFTWGHYFKTRNNVLLSLGEGKIAGIKGDIFRQTNGNKWKYVFVNDSFWSGDLIKTEKESGVNIIFTDGSEITLGEETCFQYKTLNRLNDKFKILRGELWASFNKQRRPINIDTTFAQLRILGTKFHVTAEREYTKVAVEEGLVEINSAGKTVMVNGGQECQVSSNFLVEGPKPLNLEREILLKMSLCMEGLVSSNNRLRQIGVYINNVNLNSQFLEFTTDMNTKQSTFRMLSESWPVPSPEGSFDMEFFSKGSDIYLYSPNAKKILRLKYAGKHNVFFVPYYLMGKSNVCFGWRGYIEEKDLTPESALKIDYLFKQFRLGKAVTASFDDNLIDDKYYVINISAADLGGAEKNSFRFWIEKDNYFCPQIEMSIFDKNNTKWDLMLKFHINNQVAVDMKRLDKLLGLYEAEEQLYDDADIVKTNNGSGPIMDFILHNLTKE